MFDVYRHANDRDTAHVTTVQRHDPQKVAAALENPNCIGVVENVKAWSDWQAMDDAKRRFAAFDCRLGKRGRQLQEQREKGGAR